MRRGQRLRVQWHNEITGSYPVTAVEVPNVAPGDTPGSGRDGAQPLPTVAALPPWTVVPLIIADRNLDTDANGNLTGQLLHKVGILSTPPEKVTLPFLGPFTLVNGVIWPHFVVDARWYRFRVLNASNSWFYTLALHDEKGAAVAGALRQIGTDGGLLPAPLALDQITLAPAERADVLVDFSAFQGRSLTLVNTLSPPLDPATGLPNPDLM